MHDRNNQDPYLQILILTNNLVAGLKIIPTFALDLQYEQISIRGNL